MKKLFVFAAVIAALCSSCSKGSTETNSDSVIVDTVIVDSATVDTTAADSL